MKPLFHIIAGLILSIGLLWSQTPQVTPESNKDILETLEKKTGGEGNVTIHQDPRMTILLDKKVESTENKKNIYVSGYRIQVYLGNNHKKSKDEAFEREKGVKDKFPDLNTYVTYTSPFWRLRVGDFRNHADALVVAKQLRSAFPEISKEISVVRDDEVRDHELEKQ
jgi:hypothetical protein